MNCYDSKKLLFQKLLDVFVLLYVIISKNTGKEIKVTRNVIDKKYKYAELSYIKRVKAIPGIVPRDTEKQKIGTELYLKPFICKDAKLKAIMTTDWRGGGKHLRTR